MHRLHHRLRRGWNHHRDGPIRFRAGDGVGTITATGTTVAHGCVAVDKSVIPLGTTMFITSGSYTYGMAHAEDTGVRGAKIDLFMDTYDECIQFGRRNSVAYFLD